MGCHRGPLFSFRDFPYGAGHVPPIRYDAYTVTVLIISLRATLVVDEYAGYQCDDQQTVGAV